ncbi:MAG: MFS transporter [Emcibacter sp.]|nr:MFS transporter [Emcibacter sp.]
MQGGLVGRLARVFGEKNMVKISFSLLITGLLIIIYTPFPYGVVLGLCCTGVGTTLFTTAISALASHRARPTERGLVMGVVQSMQSFGRSVGPLFAGSLFAYWEGLPYLAGVILMAIALVWMIMLTRSVMIDDASVRGNSSEKTSEKVREKTLKNVKEDVK